MASRNDLNLCAGTVLHIEGYSSRGHPPKNKYLVIIGFLSEAVALGFLISSQLIYLEYEPHCNEIVRLPHNATQFIRSESIIQCFEMERLSFEALCEGIEDGKVKNLGKLPTKYLHRVREAVVRSVLLSQQDIGDALSVLPRPRED